MKPKKARPVRRTAITISLYMTAWVLLTLLAPIQLVGGLVIGVIRRRSFVTLRLLIFAWFFFGIAMVALVRLTVRFTVLRGSSEQLRARHFQLQQWWANAILRAASRLLEL